MPVETPFVAALAIASRERHKTVMLLESGPMTGFRLSPVRPRDDVLVGLLF